MNALKHGLLARNNCVFDESREAFMEFGDDMREAWDPVAAPEEFCVARLITDGWRLARCPRIETAIFLNEARRRSASLKGTAPRRVSRGSQILARNYIPGRDPDDTDIPAPSEEEIEDAPLYELAEIYTGGTADELRKLDRHETAIYRRYQATLDDLMALQKKRLG